jgi:hypothetical protein
VLDRHALCVSSGISKGTVHNPMMCWHEHKQRSLNCNTGNFWYRTGTKKKYRKWLVLVLETTGAQRS